MVCNWGQKNSGAGGRIDPIIVLYIIVGRKMYTFSSANRKSQF